MEPDELAWVDSIPVRASRVKQITVSEFEWLRAAPEDGRPATLSARFRINSTELVAILVEEGVPLHTERAVPMTGAPPPRLRLAGRSYRLFVEAPASA